MKRLFLLTLVLCLSSVAFAQTDNGLILSAGLTHKFGKKFSLDGEVEMRTRNDFKTMDRWTVEVDASYKFLKYLKASAGYSLLVDNNQEKISYDEESIDEPVITKWRPSYWGIRHRFNVSFTGSVDAGRFSFSLRERWQYTYRPETDQDLYDFNMESWDKKPVFGSGKSVLRSRLQVEYNIKKSKFTPFANVELYNAWSVEKIRYSVGAEWKMTKQQQLTLFYRYQQINKEGDDEPDINQFGIGYNFKF